MQLKVETNAPGGCSQDDAQLDVAASLPCPTTLPLCWPLLLIAGCCRRHAGRLPGPAQLRDVADSAVALLISPFLQSSALLKHMRIGEKEGAVEIGRNDQEQTNLEEYIEGDCTYRCKLGRDFLGINES
jgi:hypothetical protein